MEIEKKFFEAATEKGCVKIQSGVYLWTRSAIEAEQKTWGDEDESKNFDFSSSPYWITTDNGNEIAGIEPNQLKTKIKKITLDHDAVASNYGTDGDVRYYATGKDDAGNCYKLTWKTLPGWDGQSEEDACDWDNPLLIELIDETPVDPEFYFCGENPSYRENEDDPNVIEHWEYISILIANEKILVGFGSTHDDAGQASKDEWELNDSLLPQEVLDSVAYRAMKKQLIEEAPGQPETPAPRYMHYGTGAVYTRDEAIANIDSEEIETEGCRTAEETWQKYLNREIFIEVEPEAPVDEDIPETMICAEYAENEICRGCKRYSEQSRRVCFVPKTPVEDEPEPPVKTEADYGREYAESLVDVTPVDVDEMCTASQDIPDADYQRMVAAGIKNPSARRYWEGFNSAIEKQIVPETGEEKLSRLGLPDNLIYIEGLDENEHRKWLESAGDKEIIDWAAPIIEAEDQTFDDLAEYVRTNAEKNNLHRLSMIDDAQMKFPGSTRADIVRIVDDVIADFCR